MCTEIATTGTGMATLVAASIAAIAAIGAAILAFLSVRKTNYTNAIVASRIKWIGELRNDFSELFSEALYIVVNRGDEKIFRAYQEASLKLILKLNPKDDAEIIKLLNELESTVLNACRNDEYEPSSFTNHGYLVPKIQALLKREWDKAKEEANRFW